MLIGFLLKGLLVGIVIAVPVGPVGILCIRRTILDGRLAGLFSGLGAATADSVFGIIAGFGLTVISDSLFYYQDYLRVGAAAFLLYVGISALMADPMGRRRSEDDPHGLFGDFASTFVLTITNPVTILSFIAIFGAIGFTGEEATMTHAAILVAGVWGGRVLAAVVPAPASGVDQPRFGRGAGRGRCASALQPRGRTLGIALWSICRRISPRRARRCCSRISSGTISGCWSPKMAG
jgi:threonine/homoserine/homoserine lactone efflux protein